MIVVNRSPVATGIDVWRATRAISSGWSGCVGSSNHNGSNGSSRCANRIAPAAVNWPWAPNSRSAREPTASRIAPVTATDRSMSSRLGWCTSNAVYGPAGSNFTAVKPRPTSNTACSAACAGSVYTSGRPSAG